MTTISTRTVCTSTPFWSVSSFFFCDTQCLAMLLLKNDSFFQTWPTSSLIVDYIIGDPSLLTITRSNKTNAKKWKPWRNVSVIAIWKEHRTLLEGFDVEVTIRIRMMNLDYLLNDFFMQCIYKYINSTGVRCALLTLLLSSAMYMHHTTAHAVLPLCSSFSAIISLFSN